MQSFAVLIMLFFSILATVLIMLMAGLAILLLLFIFAVVAIIIGAKQHSVLKGLKILTYASSIILITPLTYLALKTYGVQFLNIGLENVQVVAIVIGLGMGIIFALISHKTFEKITQLIYRKISQKVEQ